MTTATLVNQNWGVFKNFSTATGSYSTWTEFAEQAGLNWKPVKIGCSHPEIGDFMDTMMQKAAAGVDITPHELSVYQTLRKPTHHCVVRSDNREVLGPVGRDYEVIDHGESFTYIDELIDHVGGSIVAGGFVGRGEQVWGLADLRQETRIGDDQTAHYLLFSTGHCGNATFRIGGTSRRLWCGNALNYSLRGAKSIRHRGNASQKVQKLGRWMMGYQQEVHTFGEQMVFLARRKLENAQALVQRIFDVKDSEKGHFKTMIKLLEGYMESADDGRAAATRGTLYALLQAITNYVDYHRSTRISEINRVMNRNEDFARGQSALFGSGAMLKERALRFLLDEAKAASEVRLLAAPRQSSALARAI